MLTAGIPLAGLLTGLIALLAGLVIMQTMWKKLSMPDQRIRRANDKCVQSDHVNECNTGTKVRGIKIGRTDYSPVIKKFVFDFDNKSNHQKTSMPKLTKIYPNEFLVRNRSNG